MSGPELTVVILGTRTEVGKTWLAAELARWLRAGGRSVSARKPAQSFEPGEGPTDAAVLAAATGEDPDEVCPLSYPVAMAPPMAAEALGVAPPTIASLAALRWPADTQVGLVETAGGVASPQAIDGDAIDLMSALRPDVAVLVADAGLGVINDVRLCAAALADRSEVPLVVVVNRFDASDEIHRRNLAWLRERDGATVVTHDDPAGLWSAISPGDPTGTLPSA